MKMHDPKLVFMINEAIQSMEAHQGIRCGFYLRAAHDYIHSKTDSTKLEIALENYDILNGLVYEDDLAD
jgi:hypothetical protein